MNPGIKDAVELLSDRDLLKDYKNIWGFVTSEAMQNGHETVPGKKFFYFTDSFRKYILIDETDKFINRGGITIQKDNETVVRGQIGKIPLDSGVQYMTTDGETFDISTLGVYDDYVWIKSSNTIYGLRAILNSGYVK